MIIENKVTYGERLKRTWKVFDESVLPVTTFESEITNILSSLYRKVTEKIPQNIGRD